MNLLLAASDSWLFPLLIVAAALLKLLFKAVGSKSSSVTKDASTLSKPDQAQRPQPTGSDEEQIRKFLEALGQPRTAKVPPPLPPRTEVAPRPIAPVRPPQSMLPVPERQTKTSTRQRDRRPSPPTREIPPPLPQRSAYEPSRTPAPMTQVPIFEVQDASTPPSESRSVPSVRAETTGQPIDPKEQQPGELARLLRTPRGLRQAMILREVFGPPRSLQPFQDLPGTA